VSHFGRDACLIVEAVLPIRPCPEADYDEQTITRATFDSTGAGRPTPDKMGKIR
jgi:hypothetical protein